MHRETGISRDQRDNGMSGWRVRLRRNGESIANRFFADSVYGGEQKALSTARAYRDEIAGKHGLSVIKEVRDDLYATRQRLGLTQAQAAELLNVTTLTYCRWERQKAPCHNDLPSLLQFVATSETPIDFAFPFAESLQRIGFCEEIVANILNVQPKTINNWVSGKTTPEGWANAFVHAMRSGWLPDSHVATA